MNRDDEIFAEALELPASERAAFLAHTCADEAQRARIESLLAGHDAAEHFLEQPAVARAAPLPEEQPGDVIGRYTLRRKVGEGGCGVVWLAEQTEPVRRRVALKVIKLGMDTRNVIARFEAERQALAMMDHPDIARVFDAGATATGRPFFAMEFVDGVPITRFCDEHSLDMAGRLELFARVCLAMQHAHQKGVIHRDVKPSNILVALHDGVPSPKVIDFGIAKATQGRLTEHTLLTGLEQFIGTPAYMSPEQAELRELEIDTRSDVYSLGVLLYELLTGQPPFDPKTLVRAGVEEIRRIIREVEPPRPSNRIATLTDADRTTVARLRRAGTAQLSTTLRGDLDWVVMRCLEKDRDRRYATAHELADDIRRHLREEPVLARPPSAGYRARKFVARHRLACASVASIAFALIAGTLVSVRQAVRATRAEHVAQRERDAANTARQAESVARADAQRRQEQAEALLVFMLGDFRAELKKIGKLSLLDAVGEQATNYFKSLDPRDLTDTALTQQSKALTQIGEIRIDEARFADAEVAFNTAYTRATALCQRHPKDADMLFERAQVEFWIGYLARQRGDFATTRQWFTRYRDSAIGLVALEGKTSRAQGEVISGWWNLAVLDCDRGDLAAARQGFLAERSALDEMLAASPHDVTLQINRAEIAGWLGSVAQKSGEYSAALEHYRDMGRRFEDLLKQDPSVADWRYRLSENRASLARLLADMGQRDAAIQAWSEASALLAPLTEKDPDNRDWRAISLVYRLQQIASRSATHERNEPASAIEGIRTELERLLAKEPTSPVFAGDLALSWLVEARWFTSSAADMLAAAEHSSGYSEPLIQTRRADPLIHSYFAQACLLAGRAEEQLGRHDKAMTRWQRVVSLLGAAAKDSNDSRLIDPLAQAYVLRGEQESALPLIAKLKRFGYQSIDPVAASTLELVQQPTKP